MSGKEKYLIVGAAALTLGACGESVEIRRATKAAEAVCNKIDHDEARTWLGYQLLIIPDIKKNPIASLKEIENECRRIVEREEIKKTKEQS